MISDIRYPNGRDYVCDGCKKNVARFKNYDNARAARWAISANRKKCYCPTCAPNYRHTGQCGAPPRPDWLPLGYEQTEIKIKG